MDRAEPVSVLPLPDPAIYEARFYDLGFREHVSAVDDDGATHRPLEGLEIELAVCVVRRNDRDAIGPSDGGLQVADDRVASFGPRMRIMDHDIGAALPEFLDRLLRGRVARVVRVLAVGDTEDGGAGPLHRAPASRQ